MRTLYVDWEFTGEDHRERLERLFGTPSMPPVRYVRSEQPLINEADRLRRVIRDEEIEYAILDSIAFACHEKPESADVAAAYFRCLRQLGIGTLNIAHVTKGKDNEQRPFGSAFWHNGARSTWFAKRASESQDGREVTIGLFNRKSSVGPLQPARAFLFGFEGDRTCVQPTDIADVQELAEKLPLWQRMAHALRHGAMTQAELAAELDAKEDSVARAARRGTDVFVRVSSPDGLVRIGLLD